MAKSSSRYALKRKVSGYDRYGQFREGRQITPDIIAGQVRMWKFNYMDERR